ncbi:penicillin-binding protein 1A [Spirochaeta isovalerica]|uniref:peptidoglycan glycosyltransferase n=1 Tax=Spirochaeta isovalerica TaxID=150 RepID=A0A841R5B5_9SPIO|nr:PBP1A family penicillin-binding protein [Spirochaeta isovalerica]MBB6479055.1 penicillin-binding protein 1A [Spirochaeta isovalerica]
MNFTGSRKIILIALLSMMGVVSAGLGISLGFALAITRNTINTENFGVYQPAMPSQLLDINGNLITELFGDEKRDVVSITELPKSLMKALITREDSAFFHHNGFNIVGFSRALYNNVFGSYTSGGSTLTQQVAGHLYADRRDKSVTRKIRELWWAWQLERQLSKYEILEIYLNKMDLGHGVSGVEAGSQYFFQHPASENTIAENVMLVIQYALPGLYSPIRQPERAKVQQRNILNQVVKNGYVTQEEADNSFILFWDNWDWSRDNIATAFFDREDQAPWFSEYVRGELDNMLYGTQDMLRDGYTVHTTLNLDYQKDADEIIERNLQNWNRIYKSRRGTRMDYVDEEFVPIFDMLSLAFNIDSIRVAGSQDIKNAENLYEEQIVPTLDIVSQMFGLDGVKSVVDFSYDKIDSQLDKSSIETALITLDNETGYILAMIGGSKFERGNQLNRALQGSLQPGSTFKPVFYSYAISSGLFTTASRIFDGPTVFTSPDGQPYTPLNYRGEWMGNVLLRTALANSMNVPSIKIMEGIGFDAAIERASRLYGMTDPVQISETFPRVFPLALGVIAIAPVHTARAYATFANQGRAVEPIAIRYVLDRDGNVISNPEKELREKQKEMGDERQILSPQAAYIMTNLMETTVKSGTLRWRSHEVGGYDGMPMAGKTGTTQNWEDAWAAGFSPYYTTVIWAGFDKKGVSLGTELTGSTATGVAWAQYMKAIHQGLPLKDFYKPETGIVEVEVDADTGLLPSEYSEDTITEVFIAGTEPKVVETYHENRAYRNTFYSDKMLTTISYESYDAGLDLTIDDPFANNDYVLEGLDIDLDFLNDTGSDTEEDSENSLLD